MESMPKSVVLPIHIDEDRFIAVVRMLKKVPGVSVDNVTIGQLIENLDSRPAANGYAAPAAPRKMRGGLQQAMIGALMQGPQSIAALSKAASDVQFSPTSVYDALAKLRRAGIVVQGEHGDWGLSAKHQAELDEHRAARAKPVQTVQAAQAAQPALPAPPIERPPALMVIVGLLQHHKRALHRQVIKAELEKRGFSGQGTDAHLIRAADDGLVRRAKEVATWELTAKGAKADVPANAKPAKE